MRLPKFPEIFGFWKDRAHNNRSRWRCAAGEIELTQDSNRSFAILAERYALRRRFGDLKRSGAVLLVPSLACVLVLTYVFQDDEISVSALYAWALFQLACIAALVALVGSFDAQNADLAALRRRWTMITGAQFLATIGWMPIFPYLAPGAGAKDLATLGIVGTAIYCGTLMAHRSNPRAAAFHIVAMSLVFVFAVLLSTGPTGWPTLILIGVFGTVLLVAIFMQERNFRDSIGAELEREESENVVRMLLNEFEEQSSEWLWTVGPRGNLRDVSERLAGVVGRRADDLEGTPLLDLFACDDRRDTLARHIVERSAFRDLLVKLRVDGDLRYWRLSARPREDGRMSGVARDVTSDRMIEERVAFMAHYDNLTGLANRYLFNERLRGLTATTRSDGASIALFYIDLDDFKGINDTRGHIVGDRLLREVGNRLEQEVRSEDLVARLGGDEFAVLIETRADDGLLVERAHRFLAAVRAPYEVEGHGYRVSASVGIARCIDGDCDPEELMRRADLALTASKDKGRDNLTLFVPELDRLARERRAMESDLTEALGRGQIAMFYQTIVDVDTGAITGIEALMRWHHPQRGAVPPTEFLPVAEELGLIDALGEWAIEEALSTIATMPGDFRLSINLSPTQVKNPNLVATVGQAIHKHGLAAERIELEITEHLLLEETDASRATLMRLRELGVRIALDDFGTGYSSLGYLRSFPFDRIKIDRTFVEDVVTDIHSKAIISSITRLADALGMRTTAEGVENVEQLEMLRKLGVEEAQGFLISRPAPAEDFLPEGGQVKAGSLTHPTRGHDFVAYRERRERAVKRGKGRAA